mmetsp:Transcript_6559/g.23229  ORF Transcript_6559/g.23229 Transcript_6559/m.23229 type:complete len:298 (-) Transcript_6559:119-1012(-)
MSSLISKEEATWLVAGIAVGGIAASLLTRRSSKSLGNVRSTTASGSVVYESTRAVDEYLQFHFATPKDLAPLVGPFVSDQALDFPALCAKECLAAKGRGRALDVGCAVGRSTFELSKDFKEVVGFDFSNAFIEAANKMKANGKATYKTLIEGEIMESRVAVVPQGVKASSCKFVVGDACNMFALNVGKFDAVMAANLLCRVPDPFKFLRDMHEMVNPGGVFVLISPYSWLKEYTDKKHWVGGYEDSSGKAVYTKDAVVKALSGGFDLVSEKNMPFLIREHQRKYQIGCSHCMVWRKK